MFVRLAKHPERAQAIVESALFVPLMCTAMFAVLWFSKFGVMQERAQFAMRYGMQVSNTQSYQIEQMYYALANGAAATPMPYSSAAPCSSAVTTDSTNAINQRQPLPAGAPTAQPYWTVPNPSVSCSQLFKITSGGGQDPWTMQYQMIATDSISATVSVTNALQKLFGTTKTVSASTVSYQPMSLQYILACATLNQFETPIASLLGPNLNDKGPFWNGYVEPGYDPKKACQTY